jgi:hypothetical protein
MKLLEIHISQASLYAEARTVGMWGENLLLRVSEYALRRLRLYRHFISKDLVYLEDEAMKQIIFSTLKCMSIIFSNLLKLPKCGVSLLIFCDVSPNVQAETPHYPIADRNEGHGG